MAKTMDNRRADRVRSSHGSRRGRNSKRRPFLGLHPGFTVPPIFLLIGTRVPARHTRLWVAASRDFGYGRSVLVLPIDKGLSIVAGPGPLNGSVTGSAVQPSAGLPSPIVSRRSLQLRSAPSVNLACAALRGT